MPSVLESSVKGSKYHRSPENDSKSLVRHRDSRHRDPDKNKNPEDWVTEESDEDSDDTNNEPPSLLDPGDKRLKGKELDNVSKGSEYTMEVEPLQCSAPWANIYVNDSSNTTITTFSLPPLVNNGVRRILNKSWKRGIKKEFGENGVNMFKRHYRRKGDVPVRVVMRNILAYLASQGWIAQSFPSILNCEDGLTIRKSKQPFPECYWLGVSIRDAEYLEILGGSDELLNTIKLTIQEMGLIRKRSKRGHRRDTGDDKMVDEEHSIYQFRLKSVSHLHGQTIWQQRKLFILRLLERLEERGWCLYTTYYTHLSVSHNRLHTPSLGHTPEIRSFYEHATEGTWYLVKSKEWTPETPVKLKWE